MQLGRARDRNGPRLLCQQPGERDLGRCRLLAFCDFREQIDERLVGLSVLRLETRNDVAKIAFVELRFFADLAGEEAFAQRTEWNESDPEFLKRRDHLRLGISPPKRIFALECSDRMYRVGATDGLYASLGKAEVLDLAFLDKFLHGSGDVFDGHIRIDAVLIEKIDHISLQALERGR